MLNSEMIKYLLRNKEKIVMCPNCGKVDRIKNMINNHFNNCKQQPIPNVYKSKIYVYERKMKLLDKKVMCETCKSKDDIYIININGKLKDNSPSNLKCLCESCNLNLRQEKKEGLKIVKCPHCGKKGNKPIMMRWHFDNCRLKLKNKAALKSL